MELADEWERSGDLCESGEGGRVVLYFTQKPGVADLSQLRQDTRLCMVGGER